MEMNETTTLIEKWATDRNLHTADPIKQIAKLGEEFGELCSGLVKGKEDEVQDAIGDMYVVLTILAMQTGNSVEDCAQLAYNVIKDRRGKMINGVFVKESDFKTLSVGEEGLMFKFKLSPKIASFTDSLTVYEVYAVSNDSGLLRVSWEDDSTIYEKDDVMKKIENGTWIKI